MSKTAHKNFQPLRREGRLGAAISSDRKAYLTGGGINKSIGSLNSISSINRGQIPKNLLKSKSNLQPLTSTTSNQKLSEPRVELSRNLEIRENEAEIAVREDNTNNI